MTLVEFLLARITEDEELADSSETMLLGSWGKLSISERVRAECEAKRRIVEWCSGEAASEWHEAPVLKMLALPHAAHPDFPAEAAFKD